MSRENVHGFGSSGDVGHRLAVDGDVQILHQDVVQHQFFEEPVSVVPRVGGAHPIHTRLDLGRLGPLWRKITRQLRLDGAAFAALYRVFSFLTYEDIHQHVQRQPVLLRRLAEPRPDLLAALLGEPHDLLHVVGDVPQLELLRENIMTTTMSDPTTKLIPAGRGVRRPLRWVWRSCRS